MLELPAIMKRTCGCGAEHSFGGAVAFTVRCTCGAVLNATLDERGDTILVEMCPLCNNAAEARGQRRGYDRGYSEGYNDA